MYIHSFSRASLLISVAESGYVVLCVSYTCYWHGYDGMAQKTIHSVEIVELQILPTLVWGLALNKLEELSL